MKKLIAILVIIVAACAVPVDKTSADVKTTTDTYEYILIRRNGYCDYFILRKSGTYIYACQCAGTGITCSVAKS